MSSPLSSLDKSKKSPANPSRNFGKRSMPFRTPECMKDQDLLDDVTRQMISRQTHFKKSGSPSESQSIRSSIDSTLEGITPRKLLGPINARSSPMFNPLGHVGKSPSTKVTPPNDMELLSTMMKRITQLEKQTAYHSKEVLEKDRRIKVLEEKLSLFNKAQKLRESEDPTRVEELEIKCYQLQQQLYEMESFLADYGLLWIGDKKKPDLSSEHYLDDDDDDNLPVTSIPNANFKPASSSNAGNFKIDYDLMLRNVKDLNVIAGEGESTIERTKDGARLKVQESVQLTLYANGIMMFNGPFRPYSDITTQRCVGDIMDGFFPSELYNQYPDGVPIQVTDKRGVVFKDPRLSKAFPGIGRVLQDGGISEENNLPKHVQPYTTSSKRTNTDSLTNNFQVSSELPGPCMSVEQFLQKLPKNVIHAGKVVDVRSSLKDVLNNNTEGKEISNNSTKVVQTEAVEEMQERMKIPQEARPISARNITTIRVKCENGSKTYILKMRFNDTIENLRRYINKQRPHHRAQYEIISTFPKQIHSDPKKTLQESGLVPNATLHLKPKK